MGKFVDFLLSRGFIIGLSIAVQVLFWTMIFTVFQGYSSLLMGAMMLVSFVCVVHIIIKDIYPEHKIAWIIFMFLFPIAGGLFYIAFGGHKLSKKTRNVYQEIQNNLDAELAELPSVDLKTLTTIHSMRQHDYLHNIAKAPAFEHTSVDYFPLGEHMHTALLQELKQAKRFIFIESFIIEEGKMWGEIQEILIEKAHAGVDVRVLYDDMGCLMTLPQNFANMLKSHHIHCIVFNKVRHVINANFNNRDHRKICVIDGNVGFNGGINLADEYINHKVKHGHWKDTAVMLKGAGVYGLTLLFLSMWDMATEVPSDYSHYKPTLQVPTDGIVQPFGDTPLDDNSVGESVYMSVLNTAKNYVYITSPYLIITREMTTSFVNAAKSGIDVRIIVPGMPDKKFVQFLSRSYYQPLLKAGVRVFEYTPGFIHSKMFIADDDTAIVGTINLDYRSLDLHYECATMLYQNSTIATIKHDFLQTQNLCSEITCDNPIVSRNQGVLRFLALGVLRTFSPLL